MANLTGPDCSSSWRPEWCLKWLEHIWLYRVSGRPESSHMEVKLIIGKHRDRTPQRTEPQRIRRAPWLTPGPSLIFKSLSGIILSNLFLHLRATQHVTDSPSQVLLHWPVRVDFQGTQIPCQTIHQMFLSNELEQNQLYGEAINQET